MTNTTPLELNLLEARADGQVMMEFTTEHPHHRHMSFWFRMDDSPALKKAMSDIAMAGIALAQEAMLDVLGDVHAPETAIAVVPDWRCRICDRSAPAGSPGWVDKVFTDPGSDSGAAHRYFCPEHVPQDTLP